MSARLYRKVQNYCTLSFERASEYLLPMAWLQGRIGYPKIAWIPRALAVGGLAAYLVVLVLTVSVPRAGLGPFIPHDQSSIAITVSALALLLAIAFRQHVWEFIGSRNIVIGRGGVELTQLNDGIPSVLTGTVRDNFIYIGKLHFQKRRYRASFEHYASAHRLRRSILTAFRCMQSLAALCTDDAMAQQARPVIQTYFEDALALADGSPADLAGRLELAEWVRQRRKLVQASDIDTTPVLDLQETVKQIVGDPITPQPDW